MLVHTHTHAHIYMHIYMHMVKVTNMYRVSHSVLKQHVALECRRIFQVDPAACFGHNLTNIYQLMRSQIHILCHYDKIMPQDFCHGWSDGG